MFQDSAYLEERNNVVEAKNCQYASELATAKATYSHLAQCLGLTCDESVQVESKAKGRLAEHEAQAHAAIFDHEHLQEEATIHRDGRLSDLNEIKTQGRAELLKHESTERELIEAQKTIHTVWASKLGQVESKRRK